MKDFIDFVKRYDDEGVFLLISAVAIFIIVPIILTIVTNNLAFVIGMVITVVSVFVLILLYHWIKHLKYIFTKFIEFRQDRISSAVRAAEYEAERLKRNES